MKIFNLEQITELDNYTVAHDNVSPIKLMERAASKISEWIKNNRIPLTDILIVCGSGNNGGDGLALARLLDYNNDFLKIVIVNYSKSKSKNFLTNLKRIRKPSKISTINSVEDFQKIKILENKNLVIIDAMLGTGINKPAEGLLAETIHFINQLNSTVIAVDIPSGMHADKCIAKNDAVIIANFTLTFQQPKFSFMLSENIDFVGQLTVLDIQLNSEIITATETKNYFITKNEIQPFLKPRRSNSQKWDLGHALIIAGSYGKCGAAVLSAKSCLRAGAGLVSVHIPKCGYEIIQTSLPEALVKTDRENNFISECILSSNYNSIGIGPGIGMEKETQNALKLLIQNFRNPIVFDADAINILAENKTWLSFVTPNSIFTPHVREFERLVGKVSTSVERLQQQKEFSRKYNVLVVLKGRHTCISTPYGDLFFNSTGNPGMATAGSGDVLTGIITSLLAQDYSPLQACLMGVYLHGLAGDFAKEEIGEESMIASDIIFHLSDAFLFLNDGN